MEVWPGDETLGPRGLSSWPPPLAWGILPSFKCDRLLENLRSMTRTLSCLKGQPERATTTDG